jgi:NitT/TauT family transport system ATP-binding protein
MADEFEIALPHPRHLDIRTEKAFGDYTRRAYKLLGME